MIKLKSIAILFIFVLFVSCSKKESSKPMFLASSYPVYTILNEIAGDVVDVSYIVPNGASPHTYLPKPSDIKKSSSALALFYIAPNFDGWITELPTENKIRLIDMVSIDDVVYFDCGHDHSIEGGHEDHENVIDPHFWLDPFVVRSIIPELTDEMTKLYPSGKESFNTNAERFSASLEKLDVELKAIFKNIEGKDVFLHHPSFNYMLNRYGLIYAGSIEESPGKEPSPKFISNLVSEIKTSKVKAIFSEPQLNGKTAQVIANEAGVRLYELNPVGDYNTTKTYNQLLLYNANILKKALE